jgi:hypothetical protein
MTTRYDWPASPRGDDDPMGRAGYLQQLRPRVDPLTIAPPAPPAPKNAPVPHGGAVSHNKPANNQNLWFPIGPTTMTNGQAGGNPNVAGRIRDLQVEPAAGLRIYAASAGGGVWFSADRGDTWRPLDDWQTSDRAQGNIASALSCGAIHVIWGSQADGTDDIVWVGTGEPYLTTDGERALAPAKPGGTQIGGAIAGVGFLSKDPAVAGGKWGIVKGDLPGTDPDTLRGESFYRIVGDPGNKNQLIAATTKGLYLKPPGGPWTRITTYATDVSVQPMDVVMTRLPAGVRIWVASASAVMVAEFAQPPATPINPASLVFKSVSLPGVYTKTSGGDVVGTCLQLATDGSKVYVLGRGVLTTGRKIPPAGVWTINATAPIGGGATSGITATALTGTPPDLFMSAGDQSSYDMCVAVHPTVAGRIYIGGAAESTSTGYNGAIYRWNTTAASAPPTNPAMIGEGTHSDVHVLRVGPPPPGQPTKRTVWAGTDGGMFRSDSDGDPGTFVNRNDGLAVLQPGFVANHPTNPGVAVAGFQDNGTAVRTGDGVWRQEAQGDGGGVAYDPSDTNRYFRQYTAAVWQSSDGGSIPPIYRRNAQPVGDAKTSESIESDSSLFYSGCDAVAHGGDTHLVLGSDRVWYSRDWGRSWITLPTATDPRAGDNPNLYQDVLETTGGGLNYADKVDATTRTGIGTKGSGIITVRAGVAPKDAAGKLVLRVLVLYAHGLVWLVGTRAPNTVGPFTWTALAGVPRQQIRNPSTKKLAQSGEETAFQNGQPLAFLPAPGVVSDVYVHNPARGPLGSCYVTTTGWPYSPDGGPTIPLDTLWFFDGTDKWIPTGLSITHPNGTWAVATDRITAPALGVLVDPGPDPINPDYTTVYVATSVGVIKGVLTIGGTPAAPTYAWAWSQYMNGLPEAAVQDLSLFTGSGLRLLRVATQSRGVWETDLATPVSQPLSYLRLFHTDTRRVLPTPLGGDLLKGDPTNPVAWHDSPDVVVDTSGTVFTAPPSEALLDALPSPGPVINGARVSTSARTFKVHVLVHHRVPDITIPANLLKVALLRHALPADAVVPISQLWPALVAAAPGNAAPAALPDGWVSASAQLWQSPPGPVDPRLPRALTFDVDLSAEAAGTAWVFLAVVMTPSNQIGNVDLSLGGANQAQTGDQLVTSSPHVAAKSLALT